MAGGLKHLSYIYKKALGTLRAKPVIDGNIRVGLFIELDAQPESRSGLYCLWTIGRRSRKTFCIGKQYPAKQTITGYAEAVF